MVQCKIQLRILLFSILDWTLFIFRLSGVCVCACAKEISSSKSPTNHQAGLTKIKSFNELLTRF